MFLKFKKPCYLRGSHMELTPNTKKKWVRWTITLFIVSVLLFFAVQNIDAVRAFFSWCFKLARPLLIGAAIAIIINVPMKFFEEYLWKNTKRKFWCALRRPAAFLLSTVIIAGCLTGIFLVIIPELTESIKIIVSGTIGLINRFGAMTPEEYAELPFGNLLMQIDWDKTLASLQDWLKNQSSNIIKSAFTTISSVISIVFDLVVAFVFAIYLTFSKAKIKHHSKRLARVWLPKQSAEWLIHAAHVTSTNLKSFIAGQTLEALILGGLCLLGMWAFQIPYAPMISVLVGITALIPIIGAFVGGGVGAFMILTVNPSKALFFVIFLVILQQLEGNLIYPKVMGKKIHLPSMLILAAVTIGGGIAGAIGMLLSVPLTATAYTLIKEATQKREQLLEDEQCSESEGSVISEKDHRTEEGSQADSPTTTIPKEESITKNNIEPASVVPKATHSKTQKQTKKKK